MITDSHRHSAAIGDAGRLNRKAILVMFVVISGFVGAYLTLSGSAGQQYEEKRLIEKRLDFFPPVKITSVRTKRGVIKLEEEFLDGDDWLRGLAVRLSNASGKSLTYVGVEIIFLRTGDQTREPRSGWYLEYGESPFQEQPTSLSSSVRVSPIPPGDTFEIALHDRTYDDIKVYLKDTKYPASVKAIQIRVTVVGYSDGTAWNSGHMYRRDPSAPLGMSPIEAPRPENSHGGVNHHIADAPSSISARFEKQELGASHETAWKSLGRVQTDCGSAIVARISCGVQAGYQCAYDQAELYYNPNPN